MAPIIRLAVTDATLIVTRQCPILYELCWWAILADIDTSYCAIRCSPGAAVIHIANYSVFVWTIQSVLLVATVHCVQVFRIYVIIYHVYETK